MDRKKCTICWKKIDFNKDKYVKLTDYEGKKKIANCFYHSTCWQDRFKLAQEKAMGLMMKNTGNMMKLLIGGNNEKSDK